MFEDLLVEGVDPLRIVKLNRPQASNALRKKTLLELETVLDDLSSNSQIRALIITGQGDKAFCAGGDLNDISRMGKIEAKEFARIAHRVLGKMQKLPKPIIGAVNGVALGAGCDLVMACDICVASEKASFGEPPLGLGIVTPFGGTQLLPRIVGPTRAKYLFFTGERLDANAAFEIGLVHKVVSHEMLMEEARNLALKILEKAPIALAFCKKLISMSSSGQLRRGLQAEIEFYARCFDTWDKKEGARAFLEKRKPQFKGR